MQIARQYIVNENNKRVAVQIDIKSFEKMEELLEDRLLHQIMAESRDNDVSLSRGEALRFYKNRKV